MNICINIHNSQRNVHKNEKSSRHLGKKWYHGTIQSPVTADGCCFFSEKNRQRRGQKNDRNAEKRKRER